MLPHPADPVPRAVAGEADARAGGPTPGGGPPHSSGSTFRQLLRAVVHVDRSQIYTPMALRNAIGVVAPLAVGAALGRPLAGLSMAIGALVVSFSDGTDAYRTRAVRMLVAALLSGLSVFVGATTASIGWLALLVAALWSFAVGMLVLFGVALAQLGITTLILLIIFGAQPMSPDRALATAGLVCAGGLLQTLLAISAWPVRGFAPELLALERACRTLAAWAKAPAHADEGLPATQEISAASEALTATRADHGPISEALVNLLSQLELMRLGMVALDDIKRRLEAAQSGARAGSAISEILHATGDALLTIADSLAGDTMRGEGHGAPDRVESALASLRDAAAHSSSDIRWLAESGVSRAQGLYGQLRAALDMSARASVGASLESFRLEPELPAELRPYDALQKLRANLTLRSAAFRHAARLAACIAVGEALALMLRVQHAYWIPLTAAFVLRPDFGGTFARGIARLAGTLVGLLAASFLLLVIPGSMSYYVILAGALTFSLRSLGRANYAVLVVSVTGLIVVLLDLAGEPALSAIEARGIATLIGGGLALAAYAAWPTWERSQTPLVLADLLDAYRSHLAAVVESMYAARPDDRRLAETRLRARLARSNAEASVDRLFVEPRGSAAERSVLLRFLAASRRFARAVLTLEASMHDTKFHHSWPPELAAFLRDVDITLAAMASALRGQRAALESLPDLRAEEIAIRDAVGASGRRSGETQGPPTSVVLALDMADQLANAVNTMVALLV